MDNKGRALTRSQEHLATAAIAYHKAVDVIEKWEDTLNSLPEGSPSVYLDTISIYYSPSDAEETRSAVQLVLGVPAKRQVLSFGSVEYVFTVKKDDTTLRVTISNASLAPGCRLVRKERVVEYFEAECEEAKIDELLYSKGSEDSSNRKGVDGL